MVLNKDDGFLGFAIYMFVLNTYISKIYFLLVIQLDFCMYKKIS